MQRSTTDQGKNALWTLYRGATPLVRDEIILELKKAELFRHWLATASKSSYNLRKAKGPVRDIFTRMLPDSKSLFGIND